MAEQENNLEWIRCQVELSKLDSEKYLESFKVVHSYSKLLITNLILINAGGIASVPVMATFINLNGLSAIQRIDLFRYPVACFAFGLLFALFSGVAAYLNANFFMAHSEWSNSFNINNLWKSHPKFGSDESYRDLVNELTNSASKNMQAFSKSTNVTQIIGIISGLVSAAFFIAACVLLFRLKLP